MTSWFLRGHLVIAWAGSACFLEYTVREIYVMATLYAVSQPLVGSEYI